MSLYDESADSVGLLSPPAEHASGTSQSLVETKKRPDKPLQPKDPWAGGVDWGTVIWFSIVHAGALAAPFFFTWKAVALFVGLYWLTGGLGICLGYHRLLTHGSFQTYRPVKWFFAFLGGLAGEGSAVIWVANHRKHHAHSDKEGDPHSPHDGGWWSHMIWFMPNFGRKWHADMRPPLRSRLGQRPGHSFSRQNVSRVVLCYGRHPVDDRLRWLGFLHRLVVCGVGNVRSHGVGVSHHVGGEFGDAHVGLPQLRNHRRQQEPVVGRSGGLGRRLAQQSSRLSAHGPPRAQMVGVRHDVLFHLRTGEARPGMERGA